MPVWQRRRDLIKEIVLFLLVARGDDEGGARRSPIKPELGAIEIDSLDFYKMVSRVLIC